MVFHFCHWHGRESGHATAASHYLHCVKVLHTFCQQVPLIQAHTPAWNLNFGYNLELLTSLVDSARVVFSNSSFFAVTFAAISNRSWYNHGFQVHVSAGPKQPFTVHLLDSLTLPKGEKKWAAFDSSALNVAAHFISDGISSTVNLAFVFEPGNT